MAEWENIHPKLEAVFDAVGGGCAADSAFLFQRYHFLVKSGQQHPATNNHAAQFAREFQINKEVTAMRQSADWGMKAIQS